MARPLEHDPDEWMPVFPWLTNAAGVCAEIMLKRKNRAVSVSKFQDRNSLLLMGADAIEAGNNRCCAGL
jgi:hypothetical protein